MVTSVGDTTELGAHGLEPLGQIGQGLVVIKSYRRTHPLVYMLLVAVFELQNRIDVRETVTSEGR